MNGAQQHSLRSPVSVIIPCYNCATVIDRAVESVMGQICPPQELILVDDASEDETLEVICALARVHAIIKIIKLKENQGVANARNAGWQQAAQPFIAFLDADDVWHPHKLDAQYSWMKSHPDVFLSGHQHTLHDWGEVEQTHINVIDYEINPYRFLFGNCFATPTVMLKNDQRFRFQSGQRWAEDLALWQKIAFENMKIVKLNLPLTRLFKKEYGASGLSAQLWRMEGAELNNLLCLYRKKKIGFFLLWLAVSYSGLKFCKRLILISIMKIISTVRL